MTTSLEALEFYFPDGTLANENWLRDLQRRDAQSIHALDEVNRIVDRRFVSSGTQRAQQQVVNKVIQQMTARGIFNNSQRVGTETSAVDHMWEDQ